MDNGIPMSGYYSTINDATLTIPSSGKRPYYATPSVSSYDQRDMYMAGSPMSLSSSQQSSDLRIYYSVASTQAGLAAVQGTTLKSLPVVTPSFVPWSMCATNSYVFVTRANCPTDTPSVYRMTATGANFGVVPSSPNGGGNPTYDTILSNINGTYIYFNRLGFSTRLYVSPDNGNTWQDRGANADVYGVSPSSQTTVCGQRGVSTDAGATWTQVPTLNGSSVQPAAISSNYVWAYRREVIDDYWNTWVYRCPLSTLDSWTLMWHNTIMGLGLTCDPSNNIYVQNAVQSESAILYNEGQSSSLVAGIPSWCFEYSGYIISGQYINHNGVDTSYLYCAKKTLDDSAATVLSIAVPGNQCLGVCLNNLPIYYNGVSFCRLYFEPATDTFYTNPITLPAHGTWLRTTVNIGGTNSTPVDQFVTVYNAWAGVNGAWKPVIREWNVTSGWGLPTTQLDSYSACNVNVRENGVWK